MDVAGFGQLRHCPAGRAAAEQSGFPATAEHSVLRPAIGFRSRCGWRRISRLPTIAPSSSAPTGLPGSSLSGGIATTSFVTSAIYDIPVTPDFSLSLGFGLGAAEVDPSIRDPQGTHLHDPQMAFTWRAIAGVTVPINDSLQFQVDYRYPEIGGSGSQLPSQPSSLPPVSASSVCNRPWPVFAGTWEFHDQPEGASSIWASNFASGGGSSTGRG